MTELDFQKISSVASGVMQPPRTIASAATVAPTTFLSLISGTTAIATITPPVTAAHMLVFVFTTTQSGQFLTTGNIQQSTTTATANVPVYLVYNPLTSKYYYKT